MLQPVDLERKLVKDFIRMTTKFKNITYEVVESSIGVLTINRESKLNALNSEVIGEIRELLEDICQQNLDGLIFTGAGEKSFIAGADISQMNGLSVDEAQDFTRLGQQATLMFEELHFPVIAAVNGFALGGGLEFALASDFIFCTKNAIFGLPEVSLGLIPGFGGTQRLAKVIGRAKAKELIYTGSKIDAQEAYRLGLVNQIYENKDDLLEACVAVINKMKKNSPLAIGIAKSVINNGVDLANDEGLKIEAEQFSSLFDSDDIRD